MTASCREAKVCSDILASMKSNLEPLEETLKASTDYMNGSDQEREALDKSYGTQDQIQKKLTALEEQMIPAGERRFQHFPIGRRICYWQNSILFSSTNDYLGRKDM